MRKAEGVMRVLLFEDSCHTAGGTATFARLCADVFPDHGMEFRAINLGAPDGPCSAEWPAGAVVECGLERYRSRRLQAAAILRACTRFRPDVVCLSDSFFFYAYHLPVVALMARHAAVTDVVHTGTRTPWYHLRRKGAMGNLSGLAAVSRTCAENTHACLGSAVEVRVIPHGLSHLPPAPRPRPCEPGRIRLAHATRFDEDVKRTSDVIRLSAELERRGCRHEVVIHGGGNGEFESYRRLVGRLGATSVRLNPPVSRAEVLALFARSDFVVLASVFEGFPWMVLEAMGEGAVPVATRCSSAMEDMISNGESGYLVPVGDVAAMADAVCDAIARPRRLSELSRRARAAAEGFTAERMAERYREFFTRARADAAGRRGLAPWPERLDCPPQYRHWRCLLPAQAVETIQQARMMARRWIKGPPERGPAYVESAEAAERETVH